jgi:dephospho-CoA kinase
MPHALFHHHSQTPTPVHSIGLTGGIGSGKSTVAHMLHDLGAAVIDTDALSRQLTGPGGAALPAIAVHFGAAAIGADGAMDRTHMREQVFTDPQAKQALEAILHPLIAASTEAAARAVPAGQVVVFEVPLLVEGLQRWRAKVDRILVVDCDPTTQVERVVRRNGLSAQMVQRIIGQQATRAQRAAVADAVICNEGVDLDELRSQVQTIWQRWTAQAPG